METTQPISNAARMLAAKERAQTIFEGVDKHTRFVFLRDPVTAETLCMRKGCGQLATELYCLLKIGTAVFEAHLCADDAVLYSGKQGEDTEMFQWR